jgi:hypothetical protein
VLLQMSGNPTYRKLTRNSLKIYGVVGRNASNTKPAKFLVFFIKDKGAPILVPEK